MAAAYEQLRKWTSTQVANEICIQNGKAVLRGGELELASPAAPKRKKWFMI
jgi:hypothetical protein